MKPLFRSHILAFVALLLFVPHSRGLADELIFGCYSRPACGKMCKLVCEETTLTAIGYGCECEAICIPCPSQRGCKHCDCTCCRDVAKEGCPPKIEFCWYDWFACGCAKPRTVKVLTKYQAEKKICWYHWEVVDGCGCCCPGGANCGCNCVYKPAAADAQIGSQMPLSDTENLQLGSWMAADAAKKKAQLAAAFELPVAPVVTAQPTSAAQSAPAAPQPEKPEKTSLIDRLSSMFGGK